MASTEPKAKLQLRFRDVRVLRHVEDPIERDLSAAARAGDSLFVCCDETAGVDRLTECDGHWGDHRHYSLGELVDLPDGPDGEMDIEGLHGDDGWLWVVGSHSLKRDKPEIDTQRPETALKEMEDIDRDPNRFFLGRFPLVQKDGGLAPATRAGRRRMAHVKLHRKKSWLLKWLKDDPHLAPFLAIPSKENGFDVEGIAAKGLRVWIGLRGPVLRGWGVVLEMEMKVTGSGHLKPKRIDGGRRYRKHLLPTRGLGIRELSFDGEDMLVMAGPTMSGDGPAHVLRWSGVKGCRTSGVVHPRSVRQVLELPYRGPVDHPEGLVPWGEDWLVVYDSPSEQRLEGEGATVMADIWRIP